MTYGTHMFGLDAGPDGSDRLALHHADFQCLVRPALCAVAAHLAILRLALLVRCDPVTAFDLDGEYEWWATQHCALSTLHDACPENGIVVLAEYTVDFVIRMANDAEMMSRQLDIA